MAATCRARRPPRDLYAPIFSDGTDIPGAGKSINPTNHWAYFTSLAVQRYRPGGTDGFNVRYWEVWNEQDLCHFWGGTVDEYVRLLKVAYLTIKQVDPSATVMWGGLAIYGPKYEGGRHFLNEMGAALRADPMAAAHNGFFDVAAVHQYSNVTTGYNNTVRVRAAIASGGWQGKPVWVTESGVSVCGSYPGPDCPSPYRATANEQAAYIWQNIAYSRLAFNNGPIFHFQLHDDCGNVPSPNPPADAFGLVTNEAGVFCVPDNATPRLSYTAYQLAEQYLSNTELLWADIQYGVARRMAFYDPVAKERRTMVWAIGAADATVSLPMAGPSARRLSLDGSEATIFPIDGSYQIPLPHATNQNQPNSSTYTIGGTPYLIIEADLTPPTGTVTVPPSSGTSFEVGWTTSDLGSGVQDGTTTLWWQQGDGPWQIWLTGQPMTGSATFTGVEGQSYRFGLTATDRAGNVGTDPVGQGETQVSPPVTLTGQVVNMRGYAAPWSLVEVGHAGIFADSLGHFQLRTLAGAWDVLVNHRLQVRGQLFTEEGSLSLLLPPLSNPVTNSDFENGLTGWTVGGSIDRVAEEQLGSDDHALHLGAGAFVGSPGVPGVGGNGGNSTVSQRVTVPTGAPYMALRYKVDSAETDGGSGSCADPGNLSLLHDKFEIIVARDGSPAMYLHCQETASEWQWIHLNLAAYAGQTVTFIFNVYESSGERRTGAWADLVNVGESPLLPATRILYLPRIAKQ